jgi:hypothetical protein
MERRTWLCDLYPKGIGLGDLVRTYVDYELKKDKTDEDHRRIADLVLFMNYIYSSRNTPIFKHDSGDFE